MGIKTVAVFSEADRTSPHVLKANEAYCVGPPPSAKSYLNIEKLLEIIKMTGVDAVHPGYGFLSENADFAKLITKAGAIWIGPPCSAITTMGDKMAARNLVEKTGVPVVPGTTKPLNNLQTAKKIAEKIGYPILIKAAGGGGGKGMRIVGSPSELKNSMERAKSEAKKAFSDDRIFMEKYLEQPHHIEIQVIADNQGNVVSLGERECSIQRRYQKIIEETPSPFIDSNLRDTLSQSALQITRTCKYSGAGTVEFMVDKHQNYYFLEMNTRLQVEHPITEMVTGIDLVKEQILVASGENLSFTQDDIRPSGHAFECRVYAEDGFNNFVPSTGIIQDMIIPQGLGVRLDEGVRTGQKITHYYDPLIGKLITWGDNRQTALNRMYRALSEFHIDGIESTIPICQMIFLHPVFQEGKYNTHTLNDIKEELLQELTIHREDRNLAARIGAVKLHHHSWANSKPIPKTATTNQWTAAGRKDGIE
jgi:acetyl-CoA carboxylase biotin carboxylase subunit